MNFGYLLKQAGYDHIVVAGRADRPVCLEIEDERVSIRDAGSLWGMGVEETCQALWRSFGKPSGVLCIGPAGEHRVAFSMAYIDRIATMGRGGLGAVLGAKQLKAVVVRGSRGIGVSSPRRYRVLRDAFVQRIREYPYLKDWQDLGLIKSLPIVPVDTYRKIKRRRMACVSCPIGCKDVVAIADGPNAGVVAFSSSAVNLFTPMMYGFSDYRESVKLITVLDGYGLDMFEFFGILKFAETLVKQGIIPVKENVPEIRIDSLTAMEAWAGKIARREGLGDLLAGGFNHLIKTLGNDARQYAPALIKGIHPYTGPGSALPWDLFGTMELGQILEPRGPHVGSGGSPTYFAKRPLTVFPRHLERMGVPAEAFERIFSTQGHQTGLNVGALLKYSHCWFAILGSMGICARAQINRFYQAALCAELYEAVTGIETDLDCLRKRAERIWTLYRQINVKEAVHRNLDTVPGRWYQHPGFKEYVHETPLSRTDIEGMIRDYYAEWGWDPLSGRPTIEVMEKLGLSEFWS
jgi:aldehyde:ferredoxin oxidoreductase